MKNVATKNDATWVHSFERANLGKAPFRCVGYHKAVYQAIPGDPNCPIQPGSSCDFCGQGIMHVYLIKGADGRQFKVGIDCVARTGDTALSEALRKERRAEERRDRDAAWRAERAERDAKRAREMAERAERNAEQFAMVIEGAQIVSECAHVGEYERASAAHVYRQITTGERSGVSDVEWKLLALGYLAAILPPSAHMCKVGDRVRNVVARYEGGPTIGIDSPYGPSVLAKFRVIEGPNAGAVLVWKTKYHPARKGAVVAIAGTVKEHSEYQGTKQTMVTRCKVETIDMRDDFN